MIALLLGSVSASAIVAGGIVSVNVARLSKFLIMENGPQVYVSRISKFSLLKISPALQVSRVSKFILMKLV